MIGQREPGLFRGHLSRSLLVAALLLPVAGARGASTHGPTTGPAPRDFLSSLSPQERAWLRDHPVIRVAQDPGWPPMEFTDERGEPSGMSRDYLDLVQQRLGVKFELVRGLTWQDAYARLKRREIDMTTCVAVTPERLEFWAFTKPYISAPVVIATHSEVTYVGHMGELGGKKVAVVDSYAVSDWIPRDFPEIQLVRVKTAQEGFEALQRGDVFAYIDNLLIIGYFQAKTRTTNIKIAGQTPYVNAQAMAVRKDWGILAGILDKALASISETERNGIYRRWVPIRFEHGADYTLLWQAMAVFAVVLLALVLRNRRLAREVATRRKVEAALVESEQRFRGFVENANDLIYGLTPEGVITYVSPNWEDLMGVPAAGVVGQSFEAFVHPDDVHLCWGVIERARTSGQRAVGVDYRALHGDGTIRWHSSKGSALRGPDGKVVGYVGIARDATERKRAEEAMQAAEQRLADIVEFLPDATFVIDQDKRVIAWNRACEVMTGAKKEALLGQGDYAYGEAFFGQRHQILIDLVDLPSPELEAGYKYVHRKGDVIYGEIFIPRLAGGQGAHLWGAASPLFDRQGRRCGAIEVVRDVTENRRVEQALRFRNVLLSTQQEASPDGILVVDDKGCILSSNRRFLEMWGISSDIVESKCDEALLQSVMGKITDPEAFVRKVRHLYAARDETNRDEIALKDGRTFDRYSAPMFGPDDEYYGRVWYFRDITERQQAEEALRESEEEFRAMFELASIGIVQADPRTGRWLRVNARMCAITGYSAEELLGTRVGEITHPEDRDADRQAFQRVVRGEAPDYRMEKRYIRKDGSLAWVNVNMTVLRDAAGQPLRTMATIEDITERRALMEQLLQSQKMEAIGLLAGGIAHDFRNQLTVVQGYGEMLAREEGLGEAALDYVQQILTAAGRSADLSGQLLAFSRQQELRPTVANLDNVIAGLSKSLSCMVGEDVRLSVVPCAGLSNVKTDVGQFQQALVNLVVNARDAMPDGGQLTIETSNVEVDETFGKQHSDILPGPYVMTAVSDTGVGMDKATLPRIFEPFFTTKPVGRGTGLGLSMVYGFVRQSGGHVSVYSHPGQGTTFKIYLPGVPDALTADAQGESQTPLPRGAGTILVVEDEDSIRAIVARTLRESGYTVLEASGAKDALPVGQHYDGKIDLLISDVVMPETSGPDIASRVLADRPGLPVLYISGYTGKALASRGVLPSEVNLLVKPFSSRALVAAVRRLLGDTE